MDPSKFADSSPGQIVRAGDEWAFTPDPLPPKWEIPRDIWPLVVESNRQLAILEGMGRYLPNPAILLRPLEDREAIQSSRIEGTYATARELLLFERAPREATSESDRVNDWREVHNYRSALQMGATSDLPISLRLIRDLHRKLLTGVRGRERSPGDFRRIQVAIGANHRFVPAPANAVMDCLDQLEKYLHRKKQQAYDPLVECFLVHYQFETIHPFLDGNGRVGRLLLALMIQRMCNLSKPWLYMSPYFEKYREEYVDLLFGVSATNDWCSWIKFCLEGTMVQCNDTVNRCHRLLQIKDDFASRIASVKGSNRLNQIAEMVFNNPFVAIADLAGTLGVYYQTAQADVARLESVGILRELPNAYPKTYYAPDIYGVAYEDLGDIEE